MEGFLHRHFRGLDSLLACRFPEVAYASEGSGSTVSVGTKKSPAGNGAIITGPGSRACPDGRLISPALFFTIMFFSKASSTPAPQEATAVSTSSASEPPTTSTSTVESPVLAGNFEEVVKQEEARLKREYPSFAEMPKCWNHMDTLLSCYCASPFSYSHPFELQLSPSPCSSSRECQGHIPLRSSNFMLREGCRIQVVHEQRMASGRGAP